LARGEFLQHHKPSRQSFRYPAIGARAVDPNDKESVQLLGLSYYFSGKTTDAIPLLERSQSWYQGREC